ncbi:MAG: hypothetical protein IJL87_09280 [Clostridia bacterium]|nr:hypothetical protein [Clostridia bacterium]
MEDSIQITVIAAGFDESTSSSKPSQRRPETRRSAQWSASSLERPSHKGASLRQPSSSSGRNGGNYYDELLKEATETVLTTGVASASALQRRLHVGFSRAARLIDMMEQLGIVGTGDKVRQREILADEDTAKEILEKAGCIGEE